MRRKEKWEIKREREGDMKVGNLYFVKKISLICRMKSTFFSTILLFFNFFLFWGLICELNKKSIMELMSSHWPKLLLRGSWFAFKVRKRTIDILFAFSIQSQTDYKLKHACNFHNSKWVKLNLLRERESSLA